MKSEIRHSREGSERKREEERGRDEGGEGKEKEGFASQRTMHRRQPKVAGNLLSVAAVAVLLMM